jgi:hypothetical protein
MGGTDVLNKAAGRAYGLFILSGMIGSRHKVGDGEDDGRLQAEGPVQRVSFRYKKAATEHMGARTGRAAFARVRQTDRETPTDVACHGAWAMRNQVQGVEGAGA